MPSPSEMGTEQGPRGRGGSCEPVFSTVTGIAASLCGAPATEVDHRVSVADGGIH